MLWQYPWKVRQKNCLARSTVTVDDDRETTNCPRRETESTQSVRLHLREYGLIDLDRCHARDLIGGNFADLFLCTRRRSACTVPREDPQGTCLDPRLEIQRRHPVAYSSRSYDEEVDVQLKA